MMATATKAIEDAGTDAREPQAEMRALPEELKAKGWKLDQRTINDDETVFIAGNEELALFSPRFKTADEAIVEAIILQANEDSEQLSKAQAKAVLQRMRDMEPGSAAREKDLVGFRPATDADPLSPDQIRLDGGTQPREELNTAIVDQYAQDMGGGALFPAVVVFHDGKDHWLADGFHRFFAFKKHLTAHPAVSPIISAEIHSGTKRDAVLYSLGANATHGQPRSNDDKRRAVLRLLEDPEWKQWSDSAIAGAAHVSQPFVSSMRREIEKPADAAPTPLRQKIEKAAGTNDLKRFESGTTARKGKDNVVRETKAIGKPASAESITVTDRRRVTLDALPHGRASDTNEKRATSVEALLKGRMLAVSFTWIPGVKGVQATVNASMDKTKAFRKVIPADAIPPMPESVIEMISSQLEGATPGPLAQGKTKSKAPSRPAHSKKKPAAARVTARKKTLAKKRPAKKR